MKQAAQLAAFTLCGLWSLQSGSEAFAAVAEDPWAEMTRQDVATYCRDVRGIHPGMLDPYAPGFAGRVEQACSTALDQSASVTSYFEWRSVMSELVGGFRDGHTTIRFTLAPLRYRWPGFFIYGQDGGWVVRRPDHRDAAPENEPPEGAVFLGCDGLSADAFLQSQLDPARADWSKAPERIRLAYRAFLISDPDIAPAETCRFDSGGDITELELSWRAIAHQDVPEMIPSYSRRGLRTAIDAEFVDDGHVWIRLANVSNEQALQALATELEARQAELRSAAYVVFDLRGNAGGNSMWGNRFAAILWGQDAVESRRLAAQSEDEGEFGKYWRGSQHASEAIIAEAEEYAERGPYYTEFAEFWGALGERLGAQETDRLVQDECCRPQPIPTQITPVEYDGPVFVLTDAATFSSGVVVMNTLKLMGAVQLGEPSGQNEVWGEVVGPRPLPSGLGSYRIPVSIIRQPRSALGGLPPDIAWGGAMDDEPAIRAWVADLAAGDQRP